MMQKENDAKIGIVGEMPEDFSYPVADHRHAGRGGDGAAGEADGVVAEKSAGDCNAYFKVWKYSATAFT
jgi:hypothetical protein